MGAFVGALCDKRYELLYRTGTPAKGEESFVEEAFSELYAEYADRMIGDEKGIFEDMKRMSVYMTKAAILDAVLIVLYNESVDDNIRRILRSYGIRLTGDVERDFDTVISARDAANRKYKTAVDNIQEKKSSETNQDRAYFMSILTGMASHFKYNIPLSSTTVGEFCALYQQMKAEIKQMKKIKSRNYGRHN